MQELHTPIVLNPCCSEQVESTQRSRIIYSFMLYSGASLFAKARYAVLCLCSTPDLLCFIFLSQSPHIRDLLSEELSSTGQAI